MISLTIDREMIFVQPLYYNFLTTLSLILTLYFYSLSSFFSLYCFGPMRREQIKVVIKVVPIGCTYITTSIDMSYKEKHGGTDN